MTAIADPATWLAGYIPDIPTPFDENGAIDLGAFAKLCERQIEAGATAILQAGIQAHFRAIAISTALPIILHDAPSRTMRELSDDTLLRLADSRHFIGLTDGSGDITRPFRLQSRLPAGFRLLSGDDATALPFIANGGDGCISSVSNVVPELCQAIYLNCRQGRPQTARYLQSRLAALTAAVTRESPAALKYALCLLGFMSPATRLPIVELTDAAKAEVAGAIAELGDDDLARSREAATR